MKQGVRARFPTAGVGRYRCSHVLPLIPVCFFLLRKSAAAGGVFTPRTVFHVFHPVGNEGRLTHIKDGESQAL